MRKALFRLAGIALVVDGLLTGLFGKVYVRPWRRMGGPLGSLATVAVRWPSWAVRLAGLVEAILGLKVLGAAHSRVPEVYQLFAAIYDPFLTLWNATLARGVEAAVDRAVAQHLSAGGSLLDLGCGTGANVARLQRLGIPFSRYVGVDLTPEMLAEARRKFGHLPSVSFVQGDLLREPLPEGAFDLIVSTWVFSHLGERAGEVAEKALRQLKPGGNMVILMYSRPHSWLDPLAGAIGRLILAEPVPIEVYLALPGRIELARLMAGMATLVVLNKEATEHLGG